MMAQNAYTEREILEQDADYRLKDYASARPAIERARRRAKRDGTPWYVIEQDYEQDPPLDDRALFVVEPSYLNCTEFEYRCGEVVCRVDPDGICHGLENWD